MRFPPASLVALVRILRRDGFAFFGKCARHAFSRDAWRWLLRGGKTADAGSAAVPRQVSGRESRDAEIIRNSAWFDEEWFVREHPEALKSGLPPAEYYLRYGTPGTIHPGPDFVGDEYLALNYDVRDARVNPLLHYETYWRKRARTVSFLETRTSFPDGSLFGRRRFRRNAPTFRRTAIFAAFSASGTVPETTLFYLRGLREVADNIVFVANNPLLPDEIGKLEGTVAEVLCEAHGEYDFGSYKRGWRIARDTGLLDPSMGDEAIFANDSCYGPIHPFPRAFAEMESRACDFWGLTANIGFGREHIQSFFFVFRRPVLDADILDRFLDGVVRLTDRWRVIDHYETRLTQVLSDAGFRPDTLVPWKFYETAGDDPPYPLFHPLTLSRDHGMPLVKVKTIDGETKEDIGETLAFIRTVNPDLARLIVPRTKTIESPAEKHARFVRLREEMPSSFAQKTERIRENVRNGHRIHAVFLVSSASMFPARPLFLSMLDDPSGRFSPRVVVVPDLRWKDADDRMEACAAELGARIPGSCIARASHDIDGIWEDVLEDADIVCYSTPYDISPFPYNPHWAVGRPFLPIHVNYGFYRSVYDRNIVARQNYAYFWKAFFECEATAKEYAEHSILKGANAEVVGYVKMDALAAAERWPRNGNRKRVLIAPHHSVEGGANDTLALSNFQRYADLFLALPEKHPELDFVFRPHPFLFTVLSHPSRWGQAKVDDWIARMKSHPNVRWSDEGDYFPVFASCDACVQDCGSYLVEWFYTGKPCCYMLKDPSDIDAKFAPLGKDCLSHCYLAYDEAAIESFLRDVVEGGADPKAAARDEFRRSVMVNYPHAADAALERIKAGLGLESTVR